MQAIDKFRKDLDAALKRTGSASAERRLEAMRKFFTDEFRYVPSEALAALFATFTEKWRAGEEGALAWLGGVASLLLQDFDGTAFSVTEWSDIREAMVVASDEMDLDLLSYIMGLVLEHGAL